jgi:hypothetical protein
MVGSGGGTAEYGGVDGEKKGVTCGAHMSVTLEEKRHNGRIREPKRKAPFTECAKTFQRMDKTSRNSTRRFRRNLDMTIFLNSSRLLNDF